MQAQGQVWYIWVLLSDFLPSLTLHQAFNLFLPCFCHPIILLSFPLFSSTTNATSGFVAPFILLLFYFQLSQSHILSFLSFHYHSLPTHFSFSSLFHSHPQLMDFPLVEVHNTRCWVRAKILKLLFTLATLNLGLWPRSKCICPRRDRGQHSRLWESEFRV